jgi:hypothetical protein
MASGTPLGVGSIKWVDERFHQFQVVLKNTKDFRIEEIINFYGRCQRAYYVVEFSSGVR